MRQLMLPALHADRRPAAGGRKTQPYAPARTRKASLRRRMPGWLIQAAVLGLAAMFMLGVVAGGVAAWRGGMAGMLVSTALAWSANSGLAVGEVTVEGRGETPVGQILAALDVKRGMPLFAFSPKAAREKLMALGWVADASVVRRLPDTIHVTLRERRPAAIWQRNGSFTLVDETGAVIGARDVPRFSHLRVIVGEDAPAHFASLFATLSGEPGLAGRVVAAVRISQRRWNLRMDNGITVLLPEEGVATAWSLFAKLAAESELLERDVARVDLREKDRMAVRLTAPAAARLRGEEI
jgi:cell division protein FtsQ